MTTRTETGITWSSAASVTLSSASQTASDAITFDATDVAGSVQINADNAGTPASGDVLNVRIAYSNGDVLGDSGDDYDTNEHAELIGVLNTFGTDTPGEDPARKTLHIPVAAKGFKLVVDAPQGASRNIVVRARLLTIRM